MLLLLFVFFFIGKALKAYACNDKASSMSKERKIMCKHVWEGWQGKVKKIHQVKIFMRWMWLDIAMEAYETQ